MDIDSDGNIIEGSFEDEVADYESRIVSRQIEGYGGEEVLSNFEVVSNPDEDFECDTFMGLVTSLNRDLSF